MAYDDEEFEDYKDLLDNEDNENLDDFDDEYLSSSRKTYAYDDDDYSFDDENDEDSYEMD